MDRRCERGKGNVGSLLGSMEGKYSNRTTTTYETGYRIGYGKRLVNASPVGLFLFETKKNTLCF